MDVDRAAVRDELDRPVGGVVLLPDALLSGLLPPLGARLLLLAHLRGTPLTLMSPLCVMYCTALS
ncbi:hypothetical protein STENM327S_05537 [Streptomyces tendae]